MEIVVVIVVTIAAVAAALYPLLRGRGHDVPVDADQDAPSSADVEEEIARYRAALRARTLCRRCGCANPDGSVFCAECGRRLEAGRHRPRRRGEARSGVGPEADPPAEPSSSRGY